jgi:hypothetical protein
VYRRLFVESRCMELKTHCHCDIQLLKGAHTRTSLAFEFDSARVPMSQTHRCVGRHAHACVVKLIRARLPSQALRAGLASQSRTCMGRLSGAATPLRSSHTFYSASRHHKCFSSTYIQRHEINYICTYYFLVQVLVSVCQHTPCC